jgi:aminoglycoside N3'-acetyltransferase
MSMDKMITSLNKIDIVNGLRKLGIVKGDAIEVHSSLKSIGFVEGGADTVIDSLMNVVGIEGAIVMSAYPISKPMPLSEIEKARGILAKVEVFDEKYIGHTGMGIIADKFRQRPETLLGTGIHRVCAWGKNAELHSKGYSYLLEVDGIVLLLGVGIDRCSSMHQAEKNGLPEGITNYFKVPDDIREDYPPNIYLAYGSTPVNGWNNVIKIAENQGLIIRGLIGKAECITFKARSVIGIYETALNTDPLLLFGIGK